MQDKAFNYYLIVSKLAGNNVRRALCQENGFSDIQIVSVRFRSKNEIANLVRDIMAYSKMDAVNHFKEIAGVLLSVSCSQKINHVIDFGRIFVESVLKSKDARNCQKQLVDYLMVEIYFSEAYEYDKNHGMNGKYTAVDKAKAKVRELYSLNFLSGFIFEDAKCPIMDLTLKDQLAHRAFNPIYSCTNLEMTNELVRKKYKNDFSVFKSDFTGNFDQIDRYFNVYEFKKQMDNPINAVVDNFCNKALSHSVNPINDMDFFRSFFVKLPTAKRNRKFVNLKNRNSDIITCPLRKLSQKKQYNDIEYRTKRNFIFDCYKDRLPKVSNIEESRHYFNYEAAMYRKLMRMESAIAYRQGRLHLPDGSIVAVPLNMQPYEVLHKINIVYAAFFGFTGEDVANPTDWLYNAIRAAYTDEGVALYRQHIIDIRLKSHI